MSLLKINIQFSDIIWGRRHVLVDDQGRGPAEAQGCVRLRHDRAADYLQGRTDESQERSFMNKWIRVARCIFADLPWNN